MSLNFLVIGAGSRGHIYARAVTTLSKTDSGFKNVRIAAIAEPEPFKRAEFGRKFIWAAQGEAKRGQEFSDWREWVAWEDARRLKVKDREGVSVGGKVDDGEEDVVITGIFVCTLDESHAEILLNLAHLDLHVLCEKPLALSLEDCLSIKAAYTYDTDNGNPNTKENQGKHQHASGRRKQKKIFSIGHVLRYTPYNMLLRKLLLHDRLIGDLISIEHTEPIGWWHFAHSYVRGNWRHTTPQGVGTLLTKSCHDVDFILWLLCSPPDPTDTAMEPHLPSKVSSTGMLSHFKRVRKPKEAGSATNCLECPLGEGGCAFSAKKLYRDRWCRSERDTGWPLTIITPEIEDLVAGPGGWEAAESKLMDALATDYDANDPEDVKVKRVKERGWYGRCVYESDNDVVDDQFVTITWDDDDQAQEQQTPSTSSEGCNGKGRSRGPKQALLHLTFATSAQCSRRGRIHGHEGEITYDSDTITVYTFATGKTAIYSPHSRPTLDLPSSNPSPPEPQNTTESQETIATQIQKEDSGHGGGDVGLTCAFLSAVLAVEREGMDVMAAQRQFVGADLEEIVRSHELVFRAEVARKEGRVVCLRDG